MDRDEMIRILRAFEEVRLEYVLIGATAMGIFLLGRIASSYVMQLEISVERWCVTRLAV